MANVALPPGEIIVDSRGRTSLQRIRVHDHARYLAREHEDGTIVLTPAVIMALADVDEFLDNPHERGVRRERPARGE